MSDKPEEPKVIVPRSRGLPHVPRQAEIATSSTPPAGVPTPQAPRTLTPMQGSRGPVVPAPAPRGQTPPLGTQAIAPVSAPRAQTPPLGTPAIARVSTPRTKSDTIERSIDQFIDAQQSTVPGVSTPADLNEVRKLFHEVAIAHVAQVRDVMLEVRYGQPDSRSIEMTRPALQSLHAMAQQVELAELCEVLEGFGAAAQLAAESRGELGQQAREELLRRYQPLIELIPQAFELDAERDRREPVIVDALLSQIDGLERPMIEKLYAVGLNRLETLLAANASDVAGVTGMGLALATAIVEQFKEFRKTGQATVAAPDSAVVRKQLADLLTALGRQHQELSRAASEWTKESRAHKRSLSKQREQTYQKIRVALARLGERDQILRLETQPFHEKIATIERYLASHNR